MTRRQERAAILATIKDTADDNHLDGVSTFAVLRFLGHEAQLQARGNRVLYAGHKHRRWEVMPRLAHDLNDLLRVMKEHHGRELFSLDRYRGEYRVQVKSPPGQRTGSQTKFIHPDLIHAILGSFILSVD